jgi:hypothetical protein
MPLGCAYREVHSVRMRPLRVICTSALTLEKYPLSVSA